MGFCPSLFPLLHTLIRVRTLLPDSWWLGDPGNAVASLEKKPGTAIRTAAVL
jgi:hypothetical protein